MSTSRVVCVQDANGKWGSGYVIADLLILTSGHLFREGGTVSVLAGDSTRAYEATVVWRGDPEGRCDAALVEITDREWDPPRGREPRWGRLVTGSASPGSTTGFPSWLREGDRLSTWQVNGTLSPQSRAERDEYVLNVDHHPPAPTAAGTSPWNGMSGAGLFSGQLLIGVVKADVANGRHAHLTAVPMYVLCDDPRFREIVRRHRLDPACLRPADLQSLAEAVPPPAAPERRRRRSHRKIVTALATWCDGTGPAVWLLHSGKATRTVEIAADLAHHLDGRRWSTLWLRDAGAGQQIDLLAGTTGPLLVIVAHAERRGAQLAELLRACTDRVDGGPVRLLLLADTAGDWWTELQARLPDVPGKTRVRGLESWERRITARRASVVAASVAALSMPALFLLDQTPGFPQTQPTHSRGPHPSPDVFASPPGPSSPSRSTSPGRSASTTTPAPQRSEAGTVTPAWGFGQVRYVDYPIGSTHNLAPTAEHNTNDESNWTYGPWRMGGPGSGRVPTATHTGLGRQRIVLPGSGAPGGIVHATAYDYTVSGATCQPAAWRQQGIDEIIDVACFDRDGDAADTPVDALFLAGTPADGGRGFVNAGRPTTTSYQPGSPDAFNTGAVRHTGSGRYTVALRGGTAAVQVSPVATSARYCAVVTISPTSAGVACTRPGGTPVDTAFALSYTGRQSLLGDTRVRHGAFLAGAGEDSAGTWWASKPGTVTVARTATGRYTALLPVGWLVSYTHLTGRGAGHCSLVLRNDGTKDDNQIRVACFAPDGSAADTTFDLTYLTASPNE